MRVCCIFFLLYSKMVRYFFITSHLDSCCLLRTLHTIRPLIYRSCLLRTLHTIRPLIYRSCPSYAPFLFPFILYSGGRIDCVCVFMLCLSI